MDLYEELAALVDALEASGTDYAICGGIAVALHGYPRFTKDIDLLVRGEDLAKILSLIDDLGFSYPAHLMTFGAGSGNERQLQRVSKLEDGETLMLDLLITNDALEEVWEEREYFEWGPRRIQVISATGLAIMKRLAGRDQDLVDLKHLGLGEA